VRKLLLAALLLLGGFSLNITVNCTKPCLAYLPAGGLAYINFSINGSKLDSFYTRVYRINASCGNLKNQLIRVNLSGLCENPSVAFASGEKLSSAYTDMLLFFFANVSQGNNTFTLLCGGYTPYQGWLEENSSYTYKTYNLTFRNNLFLTAGLQFLNSTSIFLNGTFEAGSGSVLVANHTGSGFNITLLNSTSFSLINFTGIAGSYVYMDFGEFDRGGTGQEYYALSNGSLILLNFSGTELQKKMIELNGSRGVALTDVDGDGFAEILICANTTGNFNLTLIEYSGGWSLIDLNVSCSGLNRSFEPVRIAGYNESVVTFNSTGLIFILFNQTLKPSINYTPLAGVSALTTADIDGDGLSEIIAVISGRVKVFSVNSTLEVREVDYYGNASMVEAGSELLIYEKKLESHRITGGFPDTGRLVLNVSRVLKLNYTFQTYGNGNVSVKAEAGKWNFTRNYTAPGLISAVIYPYSNQSLTLNITLRGLNSTHDLKISLPSIQYLFTSSSFNASDCELYTPEPVPIKTNIRADGNFTIVSAEFVDSAHVNYFTAFFLEGGSYEVELNGNERSIELWKPSIKYLQTHVALNGTPVQPDQQMGNRFFIITEREVLDYHSGRRFNLWANITRACVYNTSIVVIWGNATLLKFNGTGFEASNITGNFTSCWLEDRIYLVNAWGGVNISLWNLTEAGFFHNSSFLVQKLVGKELAWNGTHIARLNYSSNQFTVIEALSQEPYGFKEEFWEEERYAHSVYHLFDLLLDRVADILEEGVRIGLKLISQIFSLPSQVSMGSGNLIASWNGNNFTVFKLNLTAPSVGAYSSFQTNATDAGYGFILEPLKPYNISITVSGFIHNSTAVVNWFNLTCKNETWKMDRELNRTGNYSFSDVLTLGAGRYSCTIYPLWTVPLPKTFSSYGFTACADTQGPAINNATSRKYVSVNHEFNITVNVTEDCWIKEFSVNASAGDVEITGFKLVRDGTFQVYNLTVKLVNIGVSGANVDLNITASDYFNRSSSFLLKNLTAFDQYPPVIYLEERSSNYYDYNTSYANFSISTRSDANVSYVNVSIWRGNTFIADCSSSVSINGNATGWCNRTFEGSRTAYTIKVRVCDITGLCNETSRDFKRVKRIAWGIKGRWLSSQSGWKVGVDWETETFEGDELQGTYQSTQSLNPISLKVTVPDDVMAWYYVKAEVSSSNYIMVKWEDENIENITLFIKHPSTLEYGINMTDWTNGAPPLPMRVCLRFPSDESVGESERVCLKVCKDYSVSGGSCSSYWQTATCSSKGVKPTELCTDRNDDEFPSALDLKVGVGFKFVKEVVQSQTTTTEEGGAQATLKNSGSSNATVYGVSLQGAGSGLSYTLLSATPPFTLTAGKSEQVLLQVCADKESTWSVQVCALVSGVNVCSNSITITATAPPNVTEEEEKITEIELSYQEKDGIYEVNVTSNIGPVANATVKIVYPDGNVETYTTDEMGRVTFVPMAKNFQIVVEYGNLTKVAQIEKEVVSAGLTFGRILVDVLIVAVLMIIGIILDEKLI